MRNFKTQGSNPNDALEGNYIGLSSQMTSYELPTRGPQTCNSAPLWFSGR
jgi:hypothetical protein